MRLNVVANSLSTLTLSLLTTLQIPLAIGLPYLPVISFATLPAFSLKFQ